MRKTSSGAPEVLATPVAPPPPHVLAQDNLLDAILHQAERTPQHTALRFLADQDADTRVFDYQTLDRHARSLAARLQERGASGERVAILLPPGASYVVAVLGCLYAGAIAVPGYPPRGRQLERLTGVLRDSGARIALATRVLAGRMAERTDQVPGLAPLQWMACDDEDGSAASRWHRPEPHGDSLAVLQYTSGSTSAPKGVCLSHANFLDNIGRIAQLLDYQPGEDFVSWLPPFHDMGLVSGILAPLVLGATTSLMTPASFLRQPARWLNALSRYQGAISAAPDFAYELCVRRIRDAGEIASLDLGRWRIALCGSERVRGETLARFAATFAPAGFRPSALVACYGLAESTVAVSLCTPATVPRQLEVDRDALAQGIARTGAPPGRGLVLTNCGVPIGGCQVAVVDPATRRTLADGRVGEVWLRGPSVGQGYWQKPELDAEVFQARLSGSRANDQGGWLRTGDLGFQHQGALYITGRLKDLLVLRGSKHHPEDLEATSLAAHPDLEGGTGAAFAVEADGEERLVIVREVPGARRSVPASIEAAIREAVAQQHELPVHEVVLVASGAIPRTSSGKVQRAACRERYLQAGLERLDSEAADAGTATGPAALAAHQHAVLAGEIAIAMAELLGLPGLSVHDDFFWLGGHSLLATQLTARLRARLAVDLPLRAVFEARTPLRLAERVAGAPALLRALPRAGIANGHPPCLTWSQQRMWLLNRLDPAGLAYNVAGAILIEGPLALGVLGRVIDLLEQRHPVLRSRYPDVDGAPSVRILPPAGVALPVHDVSSQPDPLAAARSGAEALARQGFDVARECLFRPALWRLDPQRHLLAASLHHLVTDAWSIGLLMADLLRCYDALASGKEPPPLPPGPSILDYAWWQRHQQDPQRTAAEREWWLAHLAGASALELPCDGTRVPGVGAPGAWLPVHIGQPLFERLEMLARTRATSLFTVMLATFEVLLHRHSGSTDLVLAIPVANRTEAAAEQLMGSLVNTLAVRLVIDPEAPFNALLQRLHSTLLDAWSHQELPFEQLVAELPVERVAGETPLLKVMFDFQNAPTPGRDDGRLRITPVALDRGSAQFDLSLFVSDSGLGRNAGIEYRSDLFEAATVQRLAAQLVSLLEQVAEQPECAPSALVLVDAQERAELLRLSVPARPPCDPPPALLSAIAAQVLRNPQAVAVSDREDDLDYRELDRQSSQLATRLVELGAGPGARVAVLLERDRRLVVALLAVLKSGAAYVPLDPGFPRERIAHVIEDSTPCVAVTLEGLRRILPPGLAAEALCLDLAPTAAASDATPPASTVWQAGDIAYLLYTSGSTGRPKGVAVGTRALDNFLQSMAREPGLDASDRVLAITTIAFDIAGLELWLPLSQGACVRIVPAEVTRDPAALAAEMVAWRPTLVQATPTTWKMLLSTGWRGHDGLTLLCGGEALAPDLARELLPCGRALWNMYGPTETTIWSALHRVSVADQARVPIGRPIDRTRIYVLDPAGQLLPRGISGELWIGGDGVAEGYHGRPDLNAERFLADPHAGQPGARMYRTGDAGRLRADGHFEHLGRLDDQIKLRGYRIEPGEIEAVLRQHPAVEDALVVACEVGPGDHRLVAYCTPATATEAAGQLGEHLRRQLPDYMVPAAFMALPALPRTPNGKVDRHALPPPRFAATAGAAGVAPRDDWEAGVAACWQELLGVPQVRTEDDFFRLGGHSLLAMRLLAALEQRFGIALAPAELFRHSTLSGLAAALRAHATPAGAVAGGANDGFQHLVTLRASGSAARVYCVHGAGGNALGFHDLAARIDARHPVMAFQARGVDGVASPHRDLDEMAGAYLAELQQVDPVGPYHLVGYCGGGLVAFEMARRLRGAGHQVALLALIDCYRPGVVERLPRASRLAQGLRTDGLGHLVRKLRARWQRHWRNGRAGLLIAAHRLAGRAVPFALRDAWLTAAFLRATRHLEPRIYPGELTLLRAASIDPELRPVPDHLGWLGQVEGPIRTWPVPGNHLDLLNEPNVAVLAAVLNQRLEAAD